MPRLRFQFLSVSLKPPAQVIGKDDGAAATFAGDQFTGPNCIVNCSSAGARDDARVGDGVCELWCVHVVLVLGDALRCA